MGVGPYKKHKYTEPLIYYSKEYIEPQIGKVYVENYGYVEINNLGTWARTLNSNSPSVYFNSWGYLYIIVSYTDDDGKRRQKNLTLHRLVAKAFIPNPDNLPEVNHIDGNKLNNCVTNLEWCDNLHNMRHAWNNGLIHGLKGEENGRARLTEEDVEAIRKRLANKEKGTDIAKDYGVSSGTIYCIKKNRSWNK